MLRKRSDVRTTRPMLSRPHPCRSRPVTPEDIATELIRFLSAVELLSAAITGFDALIPRSTP
jgi:hypothetical protein